MEVKTFLAILPQSHLHRKNFTAATLLQCIVRMLLINVHCSPENIGPYNVPRHCKTFKNASDIQLLL